MIGIIGTGGHAKVIIDILHRNDPDQNFTFFTQSPSTASPFFRNNLLLEDSVDQLLQHQTRVQYWHVAIGQPLARKEKIAFLSQNNLPLVQAIHDQSTISNHAHLGQGSSVMAGAIINPQAKVGQGCIVNTSASIDHDCMIEDYVNIGPGSHLAGNVTVGELTELGAGVIVKPNIHIGQQCVIGAGAVVISDIPDHCVAVGVPAKIISKIK